MKPQTHVKLFFREIVQNWAYIDTILFLFIIVISTGFTDPCEQCKIISQGNELSCKQMFLNQIGYEETAYGVEKINPDNIIQNLSFVISEQSPK